MISSLPLTLLGFSIAASALPRGLDARDFACTASFNTPDDSRRAWNDAGVSYMLPWLETKELRTNWVVHFDSTIRGSSAGMTQMDCGSIDGDCRPILDCDYYREKDYGNWYYLFRAVHGAHSLANYIREGLQDSAIEASLSIGKLIEFWRPEDKGDKTLFTYLSAAFSMASGAAGAVPEVSAFMGFMSGVTAAAAEAYDSDDGDYRGTLEDVILHMFSTTRDTLKSTLHAAMVGDKADENAKMLPGGLDGFFGQGRFLFNSVSAVGDPIIKGMFARMKQALVGVILRETEHYVLVDEYVTEAGSCTYPGAWWSDATQSCYYIVEKVGTNHHMCLAGEATACDWKPLSNEQKENVESYSVDLGELYKNSCQCAFDTQNSKKSPDPKSVPTDGSLPQCFYSLECKVGTPWDFSWEHSEVLEMRDVGEDRVSR